MSRGEILNGWASREIRRNGGFECVDRPAQQRNQIRRENGNMLAPKSYRH